MEYNEVLGNNSFYRIMNLFGHLMDQVEKHDVLIGKLAVNVD